MVCATAALGAVPAAAEPPLLRSSFVVSAISASNEAHLTVAYNSSDREFLVVWENRWPGGQIDIYAQRVSASGGLPGPWFWVGDGWSPAVAYNGKHNDYLITYVKPNLSAPSSEVWARRASKTGPAGPEFLIDGLTNSAGEPALASNTHSGHDEFLVVYEVATPTGPTTEVWAQRVSAAAAGGTGGGELIGLPLAVSSGAADFSLAPDVAYNLARNEYLVVYQYGPLGLPGATFTVRARRVTQDGTLLPGTIAVSGSGTFSAVSPAVAANNSADQYLVVYEYRLASGYSSIYGEVVRGDGSTGIGGQIASAIGDMSRPDVARIGDSELYQVVWQQSAFDINVAGAQVSSRWGTVPVTMTAFDISALLGRNEQEVAVGGGSPLALAVWRDDGLGTGGTDIVGRLLGYRAHVPLVRRP